MLVGHLYILFGEMAIQVLCLFFFWLCYAVYGILVPPPGIEPGASSSDAESLPWDCQAVPFAIF